MTARQRYRQSRKGQLTQKRYREKYKKSGRLAEIMAKYRKTAKFKRSQKAYRKSLKGKFGIAKQSAKNRNLSWKISFKRYMALVSLPCYYCSGLLPSFGGGLDRLDRFKGYTNNNVVQCCKSCNKKKAYLEFAGFKFPRVIELLRELLK